MTENGTSPAAPSPKQHRLIQELLVHGEIVAACKAAEVGRSTAYKWFQLPTFTTALREAEREALTATARRLSHLGLKAVQTLDDTLSDPEAPAAIRVRAADAVLSKLLQVRETVDLDERLTRLETMMMERTEQEEHRGQRN